MKFSTLPESEHAAVLLRAIVPEDIADWYAYLSRPEVYEHTSWNLKAADDLAHYAWRPETQAAAHPHLIVSAEASPVRFAVALRSTNRLIGTAGFHSVAAPDRRAELAYDLAPAHWGQGIASSVAGTLVRWAHSHVGITRVQATVLETNTRSMQVLQRCGFVREGLLHRYRQVRGRAGNFWMYAHLDGVQTSP